MQDFTNTSLVEKAWQLLVAGRFVVHGTKELTATGFCRGPIDRMEQTVARFCGTLPNLAGALGRFWWEGPDDLDSVKGENTG